MPRSTRCSAAGTVSVSPAGRTQVSTRPARSAPWTRRAGRRVEHLAEALNAVLPHDVAVVAAAEAPDGFHARFSATSRSYRYVVLNRAGRAPLEARRVLWWPRPLDDEALAAARRCSPASTTSGPSPRPRRTTRSSSASSARRPGSAAATISTSPSRRTRSSGTWCARSSGRCSSAAAKGWRSCSRGGRVGRRRDGPAWGLYLERAEYPVGRPSA